MHEAQWFIGIILVAPLDLTELLTVNARTELVKRVIMFMKDFILVMVFEHQTCNPGSLYTHHHHPPFKDPVAYIKSLIIMIAC
jgi:hypothetical protein